MRETRRREPTGLGRVAPQYRVGTCIRRCGMMPTGSLTEVGLALFVSQIVVGIFFRSTLLDRGNFRSTKDGYDIFDRNNVQQIVRFKVDGDRVLGMKQHLVVFADRKIVIPLDLHADFDNASSNRGDLCLVRQYDSTASLLTRFVLADQDPLSEWFYVICHNQAPFPYQLFSGK